MIKTVRRGVNREAKCHTRTCTQGNRNTHGEHGFQKKREARRESVMCVRGESVKITSDNRNAGGVAVVVILRRPENIQGPTHRA